MYEQPTETDQLLQANNSSDGTSNEKSADSINLSTSICLSKLLSMENESENMKTTVTESGESTINHSSVDSKPADSVPATVIITTAEDAVSIGSVAKGEMCRICHCYTEDMATLISPCGCNGSMRYVHQACLQKWVKSRDTKKCELCGTTYNMISSVKPFRQWKKLDMSSVERRKILCSVTFHIVAITCVIWSLYVLIDRTTQEIINGNLNWPFWTKLVVVAIGFTGGLVFMYVQCKMYVQLFKKWKQFNRVIYINDVTVESNCHDGDQGRSDTETTAQAVNVTSQDT